jgi:DNA-binding SARP family transcriptional activator
LRGHFDLIGHYIRVTVVFRLLGALDAEVNGRTIDLGHVRQRAVLAVLLVDANRPVAPEQLVDRIWGEQPPQRAAATVYSYMSRLRRTLTEIDGVQVVRRAGGYVLLVDPMAVDLHRFRSLASAARAATGEPALALFDEALGLWRGEPFAGVDTAWLGREREAVVRERLAVELDRNDLALACGRHGEVLADIQSCAIAHPLDERVAAQLMVALYRCGRQADAQAEYERVRRRLVEELAPTRGHCCGRRTSRSWRGSRRRSGPCPSPFPDVGCPTARLHPR